MSERYSGKMQFIKFIVVGSLGTLLHYAVLIVLVSFIGSDPALGAMAGATCGAGVNYCLNYRFTFQSSRSHSEALPRFLFMAGLGILLNGVFVKLFTIMSFNYLLSQIVATLIILFMNFFLSKLWIFKQSR